MSIHLPGIREWVIEEYKHFEKWNVPEKIQKTFQNMVSTCLLSGRGYRRIWAFFENTYIPSLVLWNLNDRANGLKWYSSLEQAKTPEYLDELAEGRKRRWNNLG